MKIIPTSITTSRPHSLLPAVYSVANKSIHNLTLLHGFNNVPRAKDSRAEGRKGGRQQGSRCKEWKEQRFFSYLIFLSGGREKKSCQSIVVNIRLLKFFSRKSDNCLNVIIILFTSRPRKVLQTVRLLLFQGADFSNFFSCYSNIQRLFRAYIKDNINSQMPPTYREYQQRRVPGIQNKLSFF